jgi:hypothetical protein
MEKLTGLEKETIINYNEGETIANIYTYDKKIINKMLKEGIQPIESDGFGGYTYEIPKKYIKIRIPRKLTEEERIKAQSKAQNMRSKRLENKDI